MNNKTSLSIQLILLNRRFYCQLDRKKKSVSSAILLTLSLGLLLFSIPREARSDSMTFTTDTTITEDATIAAGETWTINEGITLTINEDITITLEGELINGGTITINAGDIRNEGSINNSGTINGDSSIDNFGTISNAGTGTIDIGMENLEGGIINNDGIFRNDTTFANVGTIDNDGGSIDNAGTINNNAKIDNLFSNTITNTGTINNNDTIINEGPLDNSGTITNNGTILNDTFTLDNSGTINNFGTIDNARKGGFATGGTINNFDTINNFGTINNNGSNSDFVEGGTINNADTINNAGTINNVEGSTIDNSGTINNDCSGILEGTIPTSGNSVNDRCDPDMPGGVRVTNLEIAGSVSGIAGNSIIFRVVEESADLNDDGDTDDDVIHVYDTITGITTNLKLDGSIEIAGNLVVIVVPESSQGNTDLNDDGDTDDDVIHVYDADTGITTNLKLVKVDEVRISSIFDGNLIIAGNLVAIRVSEISQGNTDLNNDGDTDDFVVHVYDAGTGITTNLKLAAGQFQSGRTINLRPEITGNLVVMRVGESNQGNTDLNDDGDADDSVVHVYDAGTGITTNLKLAGSSVVDGNLVVIGVGESNQGNTDLNEDGDTDDFVFHVYDASTGITTNLKLGGIAKVDGNLVAIGVSESFQGHTDLNDDGDTNEFVAHVYDASTGIITNLKLAGSVSGVAGNSALISVLESDQGNTDLNDDGDTNDRVVHVYDVSTGITINLKLALDLGRLRVAGNLVFFNVVESRGSNDLNEDGDTRDNRILHVYNASTGMTTNLKLALARRVPQIAGNLISFKVSEKNQGNTDLNGDGDAADKVVFVYDASTDTITNLKLLGFGDSTTDGNLVVVKARESNQGNTDLNGDGDAADTVVHVYNANTGMTTNLKIAVGGDPVVQGGLAVIPVSESRQGQTDLNNDGDTEDDVLHIVRINETSPVFEKVSDITEQATGPDGAIVEYPLPRVTDDTDPNPTVTCEPASGSQFAIGDTEITCIATDADGNQAAASFMVRVVSEIDTPLTFTSVADATIKLGSPTENFGAVNRVNTDTNPENDFLMKFDVSGIGTRSVQKATLRLFCANKSGQGGEFHAVDNDWFEDTVTWDNAPAADAEVIASLGPVVRLTWVEVDLTSLITEDGVYSLRVMAPSRDGADYRSKEKPELAPELILTLE